MLREGGGETVPDLSQQLKPYYNLNQSRKRRRNKARLVEEALSLLTIIFSPVIKGKRTKRKRKTEVKNTIL